MLSLGATGAGAGVAGSSAETQARRRDGERQGDQPP